MTKTTFETTIVRGTGMCFIPVPFDPKPIFGKIHAPVRVTLNGYTYRSTISSMGGRASIPLRKSNREAAGLEGDETLDVTLELDTEKRSVDIPDELDKALTKQARANWNALSFTRQREYAEAVTGAKKPETRTRRIEQILSGLAQAKPRNTR